MRPLARALIYAALGIWSFICLFPIYWVAITSLKSVADIDKPPGYLPFVDYAPSLEAWRFILFEPSENLVSRFINSLEISGAATALTLLVSGMAIYGLSRFPPALRLAAMASAACAAGCVLAAISAPGAPARIVLLAGACGFSFLAFRLRHWGPIMSTAGVTALMLATRVLPPVTLALPLYLLALATGTRDTIVMMVFVYTAINIPVAVWLLLPVFGARATEQEEAAQIDGASHLTIFFGIVLPMVRAGMIAAGLIIFLMCWNEYLFAAYLTADNALTLPPWAVGQLSMKEAQVGGEAEEWAHLSAATILMMIPALLLGAFAQKRLVGSVANK